MTKNLLIFLISLLPFNKLRIFFFNFLPNYKIDYKSYIGFLVLIDCNKCTINNSKICFLTSISVNEVNIENSVIKKKNIFRDFHELIIKENNIINQNNKFYGNFPISEYSKFEIGKSCVIGFENFFDLSGSINIENNCIILDYCQIWTHGFKSTREITKGNVIIGENVKIESAVTVISKVQVIKNCIIKVGSIVTKSINKEGIYSSNELFRKN